MKKKINNSFLIADTALVDVKIVNEVVTEFTTSSGKPAMLATVEYNGEERTLFLDGGLRGALKTAKIMNKEGTALKAGVIIDIVPTGKKDLEEGFVYTYDILA